MEVVAETIIFLKTQFWSQRGKMLKFIIIIFCDGFTDILFFLVVVKCKNTIKETYWCKPLKNNLREELLSKASVYQPFQQMPHFIK